MRAIDLLKLKLAAIALIFCSSTVSYAAPSCSSFLKGAQEQPISNNPLEAIQEQIDQSQTLKEASELTYDKVALGNNVLDHAIDGIIAINTQPAQDPQIAQQQNQQIQMMIEALQDSFRIPSYIMGFAISNRLKIESVEALKILKTEQERIAIGFNRNELAKDFHADPTANNPIGFAITKSTEEKKISGNLFFQTLMESLNPKAANDNGASAGPTAPLGFVHPKPDAEAENTKPLAQMGFVQPSKAEESFKSSDLPEIVLNVKNGEFRIISDPNKGPIGFINSAR